MPYWRLSSFYLFYFAILGILIPYWGLYLASLGFTPFQIGQQTALLLVTKIIAPYLWAWVADHTGKAIQVARLAAILAFVTFLTVFLTRDYWWLTLVMIGFGFFWNAVLPQLEAITLNHLGEKQHNYGHVRLWGSIGFIGFVALLGPFIDALGAGIVVPSLAIALSGLVLVTFCIPGQTTTHPHDYNDSVLKLFRRKEIVTLLVVCLLMQVSHAPLYTFFSIYLSEHGYSKTITGGLWAIGVICEIAIFLISHRLFRRFSLQVLLLVAFGATIVRWVLVAQYPDDLWLLVLTQMMHALTFGVYHATAIQYIHRLFRGRNQHRGQALYSSFSFGVGGGIGSFASGLLWTEAGPHATFMLAALVAALAFVMVLFGLRARTA